MFEFHPIAIPGILALACAWSLAAVVWATGPGQRRDRLLELLLFIEGLAWGTGSGFLFLMENQAVAWTLQSTFVGAMIDLPPT